MSPLLYWWIGAVCGVADHNNGMNAAPAEHERHVENGLKVALEYAVSLADHTVLDSNVGKEPHSYIQGAKQIVPGLEREMVGMKIGQQKIVQVPAAEAYGEYKTNGRFTVEKHVVPPEAEVGTQLTTDKGRPVWVQDILEGAVVLDLNHPLAGQDLTYDVRVLAIEDP